MIISEVVQQVDEEQVFSSWIDEIELDDQGIIMTLLSGRVYLIYGAGENQYDEWLDAPSPGQFWHSDIRDMYNVSRIA